MPKLSDLKVRTDLVEDGEWHVMNFDARGPASDTDDPDKLYFLIGHNLSARYRAAVREILTTREVSEEQEMRIAARSFLIGWKNYLSDDGAEVEYSETEAYRILTDPSYVDIRQYILAQAQSRERVRQKRKEELQKN